MKFSSAFRPSLQNKLESSRATLAILNSANPFIQFALTPPNIEKKIDWKIFGIQTTFLCQNAMTDDWKTKSERNNWLWEQSNTAISDKAKDVWGWDCLAMLNLVNNHL